jgi:hypothetical protein
MGAPKKYKGDTITFTYRTEADRWKVFNALLSLKGENPTGFFTKAVDDYINENKKLFDETFQDLIK